MQTSTISHHDWSLHRKGSIDQERHKQKIREAIKKNLADIVSEESIILSDGERILKVPIRSWSLGISGWTEPSRWWLIVPTRPTKAWSISA